MQERPGTPLSLPRRTQPAPTALAIAGAFVLLLAVGWVDYATGTELRAFPLYFLPLMLVTLRFGRAQGLAFAVACSGVWLASNRLAGMGRSHPWLLLVNAAIMLAAFAFVTIVTAGRQRSLEHERALSRTDTLTGIPNSRGFYEAAAAELERAGRYRHPLTLAYLDIDDFKAVNDSLGHARGDELLRDVGRALRRASRASDIVGRLGGDEFVILYPQTGREAAEAALRNLRAQLAESLRRRGWERLTLSIGAVSFATPPREIETLVHGADRLMYGVKASGKDGVRVADAELAAD